VRVAYCKRIAAEKEGKGGGEASRVAVAKVEEEEEEDNDDFSLKNVLKKVREASSVGIVFNIRVCGLSFIVTMV
jgi:hypothetical protein